METNVTATSPGPSLPISINFTTGIQESQNSIILFQENTSSVDSREANVNDCNNAHTSSDILPLDSADENVIGEILSVTTGSNTAQPDDETTSNYVGIKCFFLENPDGIVDAVAGLENIPRKAADLERDREPEMNHLQCHSCSLLLEYDSRAAFVQCGGCQTLNAVQPNSLRGGRVMIVICGRCHTRNIAGHGSTYVECWLCHTVCQVDYPRTNDSTRTRRLQNRISLHPRSGILRFNRAARNMHRRQQGFNFHNSINPNRGRRLFSRVRRNQGHIGASETNQSISRAFNSEQNIENVEEGRQNPTRTRSSPLGDNGNEISNNENNQGAYVSGIDNRGSSENMLQETSARNERARYSLSFQRGSQRSSIQNDRARENDHNRREIRHRPFRFKFFSVVRRSEDSGNISSASIPEAENIITDVSANNSQNSHNNSQEHLTRNRLLHWRSTRRSGRTDT